MEALRPSDRASVMPRVAFVVVLAVLTLALCGTGLLSASGPLDGKIFVGETGEKGKTKGEAEEIDFRDGTFHSKPCDPYGFGRAPYKTTVKDGVTTFEAVTTSAKEGKMTWKGTVKGDVLEGTVVWSKAGQQDIEYWVKARLQK